MYDLVIKFKRNAQKNIGKNIAKSSLETYKQDKTKITKNDLVIALKLNKLMLKKDENLEIFDFIKDKISKDNVLTFYSLAKLYKLGNISESSLLYIERCFPMIVETQNFLHLDFSIVAKILASSELNIHSEVEIFNGVITWLKHNSEERSKYAKQLLLKVRFILLSEHALEYTSNCYSTISKNQKYNKELKEAFTNCLKNESSSCYTNRYCGQNMFNIIRCGGYNVDTNIVVNTVNQFSGIDLKQTKVLSSMKFKRRNFKAVCLKGEIYVFGGRSNANNVLKSVEKYSPFDKKWSKVFVK